jgi:nuclear receptor subfamily 2 group E protein 1
LGSIKVGNFSSSRGTIIFSEGLLIHTGSQLVICVQLLLLEQSWAELFVLGAAQYLLPLELGQLVSYRGVLAHRDTERTLALLHEVKAFQDTLNKFKQLHVDPHEYACLRAIVLFRTNGEL